MIEKYPGKVKLIFKNYPLSRHEFAKKAAVAAFAARRQGKFWEFHDRLVEKFNSLSDQEFRHIARDLGLDLERFERDVHDLKIVVRVNQDIRLGAFLGLRGTPTVFINGRVSKARTLEALQADVEKELAEASRNGDGAARGRPPIQRDN